jgi:hypothetical protein
MYPDKQRRFELRKMLDEVESQLEVSESEKILSQLAFLMDLCINERDDPRLELRDLIGAADAFASVTKESLPHLQRLATECHVRSARLIFWMWRSWILQKDLPGSDVHGKAVPGLDEVRLSEEWEWLPEEVLGLRIETLEAVKSLELLAEELSTALAMGAGEASYLLGNLTGSPIAVLTASATRLKETLAQIEDLKAKVWSAYGFDGSHRPNKRFDRHTVRDITAFFWWKRGVNDARLYSSFEQEGKSTRHARTAAIKAASRYELRLYTELNGKLEALEESIGIPVRYFARKLRDNRSLQAPANVGFKHPQAESQSRRLDL